MNERQQRILIEKQRAEQKELEYEAKYKAEVEELNRRYKEEE